MSIRDSYRYVGRGDKRQPAYGIMPVMKVSPYHTGLCQTDHAITDTSAGLTYVSQEKIIPCHVSQNEHFLRQNTTFRLYCGVWVVDCAPCQGYMLHRDRDGFAVGACPWADPRRTIAVFF